MFSIVVFLWDFCVSKYVCVSLHRQVFLLIFPCLFFACVCFVFIFVFVVAIACFLIRETGRKDVGLGEWGGRRVWKELGERKQ